MSREYWMVLVLIVAGLVPLACFRRQPDAAKQPSQTPSPTMTPDLGQDMMLDLGQGMTMKLVRIPAGTFLMGSPSSEKGRKNDQGPQRQVTITRPFRMGIHEVTRGQFAAFVSATNYKTTAEQEGWTYARKGKSFVKVDRGRASWRKPGFAQTDNHPVVCVNWEDAMAFCKWLSRRSGRTVSLPTEAQWEYACRAGSRSRFSFGELKSELHRHGNYADSSVPYRWFWRDKDHSDGHIFSAPVGKFKPNAWGLYDMHGNALEACRDWYSKSYADADTRDPKGPSSGKSHVLRGGFWKSKARHCRAAFRYWYMPGSHASSHYSGAPNTSGFGLRVVVESRPTD